MAETEKFSKFQTETLKHIQKKGFAAYHRVDEKPKCPELEVLVEAGYLDTWYLKVFDEDVYKLTEKGESLVRSLKGKIRIHTQLYNN